MGCGQPATPGCYMDIVVNGSGWAPNQTYPLTLTGPNLPNQTVGQTVATDANGAIVSANPMGDGFLPNDIGTTTSDPPTPGTYTVTIDGVSGSYTYAPPEAVSVWSLDNPNTCAVGDTTCTFPIQFIATGFVPDTAYPETTTWNGAVINQTVITTDVTGSVPLADVGTTTPTGSGGTATVTFGGLSANYTIAPAATVTITTSYDDGAMGGEPIGFTATGFPPSSTFEWQVIDDNTLDGGMTCTGTLATDANGDASIDNACSVTFATLETQSITVIYDGVSATVASPPAQPPFTG